MGIQSIRTLIRTMKTCLKLALTALIDLSVLLFLPYLTNQPDFLGFFLGILGVLLLVPANYYAIKWIFK